MYGLPRNRPLRSFPLHAKSIRCYFSVFPIFSNVFIISSNLFWQHIMNFDTVHFGCSGFFAKAIRNLLNAVEFVFEFPSLCLCRSSPSCTSRIFLK